MADKVPIGGIIALVILVFLGIIGYFVYKAVKGVTSGIGGVVGGIEGAVGGVWSGVSSAAGAAETLITSPATALSTAAATAAAQTAAVKAVVASSSAANAATTTAENNSITNGSSAYTTLMVEVNAYDPIVAPLMTLSAYNAAIAAGIPAGSINVYLNAMEDGADQCYPGGKYNQAATVTWLQSVGVPAKSATAFAAALA
jgi:hypothetical protein